MTRFSGVACLLIVFVSSTALADPTPSDQFDRVINVPPTNLGQHPNFAAGTQVNFYSGGSSSLSMAAGSELNVYGGQPGPIYTSGRTNILGGVVEGPLAVNPDGYAHIIGGAVGRTWATRGGVLEISGGSVGEIQRWGLDISNGGITRISGGTFGSQGGRFDIESGTHATFYGGEFRLDGVPITGLESVGSTAQFDIPEGSILSGTFQDGTPFAFTQGLARIAPGVLNLEVTSLPDKSSEPIIATADGVPLGVRDGETLIVDSGGIVPSHFRAGYGSTVHIQDGAHVGGYFAALENSVVDISGGIFDGALHARNGSTVNVSGGQRFDMTVYGDSVANISGGTIGGVNALSGSTVNLSGGELAYLDADPGSSITIRGSGFQYSGIPLNWLEPGESFEFTPRGQTLESVLSDGTPFTWNLSRAYEDTTINLILEGDPPQNDNPSSWINLSGNRDWHTIENWSNGIPQQPGDVADISNNITTDMPVLSADATLGELSFRNRGAQSVTGTGTLTFDNPTTDPGFLRTIDTGRNGVQATVSVPIYIADSEGLRLEVGDDTELALQGAISNSPDVSGNFTKVGPGELTLSGDSPTWGGTLTIEDGPLIVDSPTALGSSTSGTVVKGGNLRVNHDSAEPVRIEGGQLNLFASQSGPITLVGGFAWLHEDSSSPVIVASENSLLYAFNNNWTGGSSGTGTLTFGGSSNINAPLAHDGDTVFDGGTVNVANTYTGDTTITGTTTVNHSQAFSTATTPIRINEGNLILNELLAGDRQIIVERGWLTVQTNQPINQPVILGTEWSGAIFGNGVFNAPIQYTSFISGESFIASGTFNGPIMGEGELHLGQGDTPVVLNHANSIGGRTRVRGGTVVVNDAEALNQYTTQIESGILELNVPAITSPWLTGPRNSGDMASLRLNVNQQINETWMLNSGTIEANANVSFGQLLLLGMNGKAIIKASDGQSVEFREPVTTIGHSSIEGKITGNGPLRSLGWALEFDSDMSSFTGDIEAVNGRVSFSESSILGTGNFYIGKYGTVDFLGYFTDAREVTNTIYLHNGIAPLQNGVEGLTYSQYGGGPLTLAGTIDVGTQGGTIRRGRGIHITGTVDGHALNLVDTSASFYSVQNELDELHLTRSQISFDESGALQGLERVYLYDGTISLPSSSQTDRIGDSVEIHSYGGRISLTSSSLSPTSERLGLLHLQAGTTSIFASSDHGGLNAGLTFGRIERETGAFIRFEAVGRVTSTKVESVDTFDGSMIGAWAFTGTGFASIDAQGIVGTLQSTSSNVNTAVAADHLVVASSQSLTSDREIASLSFEHGGALDLGGHNLTVRSGGVSLVRSMTNGNLTAGTGSPAELIFVNHQDTTRIGANIVDNGSEGNVTVVIGPQRYPSSGAPIILEGANEYSGGTWVVGSTDAGYPEQMELRIENLQAIPENDRVHLDFGHYSVQLAQQGIVRLAELHVRNDSSVTGRNVSYDADSYYVEQGMINAPLTGDGTFYKDGSGRFFFNNDSDSPNYAGKVYVREGTLRIERDSIPNASIIVEGGQLDGGANRRNVPSSIQLSGGELTGYYSGPIEVTEDSSLYEQGDYTLLYGELSGDGDLTIRGTWNSSFTRGYAGIFGDSSNYTGDLHVESGSLRIGAPARIGPGVVNVLQGSRFILASDVPEAGPTYLDRDVHLHGGTLYATPPSRSSGQIPPGIVNGDLYVYGESFIGAQNQGEDTQRNRIPGLQLAGSVILTDNARVYGLSDNRNSYYTAERPLVEISGDVLVGQNNVWQLGTSSLLISGMISPNAARSSIDFQGVPTSLDLSSVSLKTIADRELRVTINGELLDFELSSAGAQITGDGTFAGNVTLSNGAAISPGNSPGLLTIDGLVDLERDGLVRIELGGTVRGDEYDAIDVTGPVEIDGILDLSLIDEFTPSASDEFVIIQAPSITGDFSNAVDAIWAGQYRFDVDYQGTQIVLSNATFVPEPSSCIMLLLTTLLALGARNFILRVTWIPTANRLQ